MRRTFRRRSRSCSASSRHASASRPRPRRHGHRPRCHRARGRAAGRDQLAVVWNTTWSDSSSGFVRPMSDSHSVGLGLLGCAGTNRHALATRQSIATLVWRILSPGFKAGHEIGQAIFPDYLLPGSHGRYLVPLMGGLGSILCLSLGWYLIFGFSAYSGRTNSTMTEHFINRPRIYSILQTSTTSTA